GFWQLERAEEKSAISREFELMRQQPPAPLTELVELPQQQLAYRPVQLRGQFHPQHYFLLDNKMVQGRYGNEVLGVFELAEGSPRLVLVNRGWVVADPGRRSLPDAPPVQGELTLAGQVYVAPGKPYMLADKPLADGWPKRVQAVQLDKIAAALDVPVDELFPYPVRIDADDAAALYVDWPLVNVSPAKHFGYAVQWFLMSAVLAFLYLVRSSNLLAVLGNRGRTPDDR
ncbi:MAG: SURF1 family protein, partial [Halioglobus sp.]|nr:SURF1 family protein [Halioglobus sp.]